MNEKTTTPSLLRLAAAVFLGLIVGFILFLIVALFIGMFNNLMGMNIPVGMDFAENIISAILLVIFVGGCMQCSAGRSGPRRPLKRKKNPPRQKSKPELIPRFL